MKKYLILLLLLLTCCNNQSGYDHLMSVLNYRDNLCTHEQKKNDGNTCYTIDGYDLKICALNRDEASEKTAHWIELNIPETRVRK
jgi:hypothetical protein